MKEAYRPMRVREGERNVDMPANQASLRANFMAASMGDRRAFETVASVVSGIESKNEETQFTLPLLNTSQTWQMNMPTGSVSALQRLPGHVPMTCC